MQQLIGGFLPICCC